MTLISIVLPVMNEATNIEPIYKKILECTSGTKFNYEIIFVCDPSSDGTEIEIEKIHSLDSSVVGIYLADRAGQTEAIRAGYEFAKGSAIISMDADFQDPPELLPEIISAWNSGALIVHTKRGNRKSDAILYRFFTNFGYRVLAWLTRGKIKNNVGDYRLIDRKILTLVLQVKDPNPFWRGITSLAGVKSTVISYKRPERKSGKTKYSLTIGSPAIALRGLASFSNKPLELLQSIGIFSLVASVFVVIGIVSVQVINPGFSRGVPTIIALLAVFFSIQFASTAIIATYLIVLIEQTRRRPNYLVLPDEK